MTLRDVRDTLLQIAHPDRVLRYADGLMELRRKHGDNFTLTSADAWLLPLLEFYTEDLDGWCKFVRGVRDRLEPKTPEYDGVHEYFKVITVRNIQRRTRNLTDIATVLAVKRRLIPDTYDAKQRYAKRCIQFWSLKRRTLLANARLASPKKRLSLGEQEEILADFWDGIEQAVTNREIPAP